MTAFDDRSTDAMFATLLAKHEAAEEKREDFRTEIRTRFDKGAARMDAQDRVLEEIRLRYANKAADTDARLSRLEDSDTIRRLDSLEAAEITIRTDIVRAKTALWVIGGVIGVLQSIALTLLNIYLRH